MKEKKEHNKNMIDKEILKDTAANAYKLGQKDGFKQGELAMVSSLIKTMDKMNQKTVNYETIKEIQNFLIQK